MAGLRWMAVTLAVFLSTGNSLDVGQNQLATIVQEVLDKYTKPNNDQRELPMFSLAVSIPKSGDSYDVAAGPDNGVAVKNAMLKCEVYTGTKVVGATLLRLSDIFTRCKDGRVQRQDVLQRCPERVVTWLDVKKKCRDKVGNIDDHAEYRTLQALRTGPSSNFNDLMLFYVYAAPCHLRCTQPGDGGILNSIKKIKKWGNYAVVFKKLFNPSDGTVVSQSFREQSLLNLASLGKIDLKNIFRCDYISGRMQCVSCSTDGGVTPYCVSDDTQTGFQPQQGSGSFRGGGPGVASGSGGAMNRQGSGSFRGGGPGVASGSGGAMNRQGSGSFRGGGPGVASGSGGAMNRQGSGSFRGGGPGVASGRGGAMNRQGGGSFRGGGPGVASGRGGAMNRQGSGSFRGSSQRSQRGAAGGGNH
ncbi:uncharacterized protein LOC111238232 [Seriola dumerili]|uniref:uncharacterized protein LOC111238232 n=1 Tax=Seriola dumerili TaxID=41447 RepID=UPI000BBEB104|nr:uncharacterized protein LOC111238232 [Seriola dumerili]